MNEALKLAIEKGGYKELYQTIGRIEEQIALDPLFWQALGKALGWDGWSVQFYGDEWLFHAHQYFDLVLTGGDTEAFWKELIK